jgi:cytochrome c oxidase cbb3-type subunit 3
MSTEENINQELEQELKGVEGNLIIDHEYDGIKELDNKIPPWLNFILYGTIIFSAIYMFRYHVFHTAPTQEEEYEIAVAEAEANKPESTFDANAISLLTDEASLAEGMALFTAKTCNACHGNAGEGNVIGPNLTDNAWMHGNTPEEVYAIIRDGSPNNKMTAYGSQISEEDMLKLTSYVLVTLQGSNPPNAKEAEGEVIE